jgi:predicted transcriptional regulator
MNFIENVGKSILNLREELNDTKREVDEIITENDKTEVPIKEFDFTLTEEDMKVLDRMVNRGIKYQAISKIATDVNLDKESVRELLKNLTNKKLVESVDRKNGKKWMVTEEGKAYYNYYHIKYGEDSSFEPII